MDVDAADGGAGWVDDDEVVDVVGFVEFEDVDGEHVGGWGS